MARRWERLEKKYKNQLRCENCNRWTAVTEDIYQEAKDDASSVFLCARERCIASRPETLLPKNRRIRVLKENPYQPARVEGKQKERRAQSSDNSKVEQRKPLRFSGSNTGRARGSRS